MFVTGADLGNASCKGWVDRLCRPVYNKPQHLARAGSADMGEGLSSILIIRIFMEDKAHLESDCVSQYGDFRHCGTIFTYSIFFLRPESSLG